MYVAKALNKPYIEKPIGKKSGVLMKIGMGCSLVIVVICLLAGPLLLFSNINPISKDIYTNSSALSFKLQVKETTSEFDITLFSTTKTVSNIPLNSTFEDTSYTYYDKLQFANQTGTITYFQPNQIQAFQMAADADDIWTATGPNKVNL
jgi:hypothetical protein